MAHPFAWLSDRAQRHALILLGLLAFTLTTFLGVLGGPLYSAAAPRGIVSFELAGSGQAAQAILDTWSPGVRELAMLNLGLDYLYLVAYPAFLAQACVRVARRLAATGSGLAAAGPWLSWLVLLAGPLDAVENAALIRILAAGASDAMAGLAWACAVPKFALVAAAALYLGLGLLRILLARRARPEPV